MRLPHEWLPESDFRRSSGLKSEADARRSARHTCRFTSVWPGRLAAGRTGRVPTGRTSRLATRWLAGRPIVVTRIARHLCLQVDRKLGNKENEGHSANRTTLVPDCVRRRPTLPRSGPRSTIGAERLSFRVRDGTGRFPLAMVAETLWRYLSLALAGADRTSGTAQWTRARMRHEAAFEKVCGKSSAY